MDENGCLKDKIEAAGIEISDAQYTELVEALSGFKIIFGVYFDNLNEAIQEIIKILNPIFKEVNDKMLTLAEMLNEAFNEYEDYTDSVKCDTKPLEMEQKFITAPRTIGREFYYKNQINHKTINKNVRIRGRI